MPNKEFLEKYPLYRKFEISELYGSTRINDVPKPAIHMYCEHCDSEQTFNMVNDYDENLEYSNTKIPNLIVRAYYECSACGRGEIVFLIKFVPVEEKFKDENGDEKINTKMYVMKVGQYPAWSIDMDKELEKMLGEYSEYYRRGLICESQSYGIGAYAYFRRITEDIIDELLESILNLVEESEKKLYKEKLAQVKKEKIAENKINLVKDLLPKSLQVNGMNPLKELYGVLSQGIHNKSDEECMEKAEAIRGILVFLANQVIRTKNDKKSFTEGMKKILSKR